MRILKCSKKFFCNINRLFHTMIIEKTLQSRLVNVDFGSIIFLWITFIMISMHSNLLEIIGGVTNFFVESGRLSRDDVCMWNKLAVWEGACKLLCRFSDSRMEERESRNSLCIIFQIREEHLVSNRFWDSSNVEATAFSWYWRI